MSFKTDITEVKFRLGALHLGVMIGFLAVAIAMIYWSVLRGPIILAREDNPRLVEAELRIQRGRILDANNVVLAETVGSPDDLKRIYPVEGVGTAVGYYSFRHGTSGIENSYDSLLRGDSDDYWTEFWRIKTLHEIQAGQDIRLTIDARLQQIAHTTLDNQRGAVVLFSLPDAGIKAMASYPDFDPNHLDEQFDQLIADEDAPLINRVTQGQYQPGMLLQPFLVSAAMDAGLLSLDDNAFGATDPVIVNGNTLQCIDPEQSDMTWLAALQHQCPGAMVQLAGVFGAEGLQGVFEDFGLLSSPDLEIETEATAGPPVSDLELAAVGQDTLSVSPLQMGMALAALANGGEMPQPTLILATEEADGMWTFHDKTGASTRVVDEYAAEAVLSALSEHNNLKEHSVLVLSGPEGSTNAWYLGLAPADSPRYGVVVVLEDKNDVAAAKQVGRTLLTDVIGLPIDS